MKINVHSNQEGATLNIMLETIGGIWVVSEALKPKPSALYQLFTNDDSYGSKQLPPHETISLAFEYP